MAVPAKLLSYNDLYPDTFVTIEQVAFEREHDKRLVETATTSELFAALGPDISCRCRSLPAPGVTDQGRGRLSRRPSLRRDPVGTTHWICSGCGTLGNRWALERAALESPTALLRLNRWVEGMG